MSDDSVVGVEVDYQPTLVDAFNDFIPDNGDGVVEVPLAIKHKRLDESKYPILILPTK